MLTIRIRTLLCKVVQCQLLELTGDSRRRPLAGEKEFKLTQQRPDQRDGLDRFAEAHVVGEDAALTRRAHPHDALYRIDSVSATEARRRPDHGLLTSYRNLTPLEDVRRSAQQIAQVWLSVSLYSLALMFSQFVTDERIHHHVDDRRIAGDPMDSVRSTEEDRSRE